MLEALRPLVAQGRIGAAVKTAADLIRDEAPKASNYPYSDQRQFLGNALSGVAATLGRASPGLDHSSAAAMADVLAASPTHYLSQQVRWVRIFGLRPETAAIATAFAGAIADFMLKDGSLDSRLTKYAELAYALWVTSPEESAAYVRLALEKADGLSGDDYEESHGLIGIAVHYEGPSLDQDVVFAFARLCEAQMPEDTDRYAWREFSEALARIGGLDGLAVSARLEDRDKGGLDYNHLMLSADLVEHDKLAPELAVALSGLKPYRDFWVFRLTDFLGKVLPKLDPAKRELAFQYAAEEWDRESLTGTSRNLARLFADLASQWLPAAHPLLARFQTLASPGLAPSETETLRSLRDRDDEIEILTLAERLDASTPDALDAGLDAAGLKDDEPRLGAVLQKLGERALTAAARLKFAEAVAGSNRIRLSEKLWGLTDHVQTWSAGSLMFRNTRRALAETLVVRHVETLMGGRWDGGYDFRRVLAIAGGALPEHEAVALMLRHVRPSQFPNRTAWLEMAAHLAPIIDPQRLGDGLIRYVTRADATLEPNAQGGAWAPDRAVSADEAVVVAGTLWRALGAVRAEHRWRAAHAVRRLVTVGRRDVLAALMAMIDREDAAPHQSADTRFRFLDARLWLLLAADRIAVDQPEVIRPFRDTLARIAGDNDLPHVLMRELAGRSLGRIIAAFGAVEGEPDLATVNRSPFEPVVSAFHGDGYYDPKPGSYVERDPPFHFDYDFDKSEVMGVARLFGAHRYETGDQIAGWVRRWEAAATNMWRSSAADWNQSPVTESFVGHLAWHGLFLATGDFLKTRPLVATDWRPDPLRHFLDQELLVRPDGRWLADDTGLTPPDAYLAKRHRDHLPRRATLPDLVGLADRDPNQIVVNGAWNSQDDVEFWVRSAFVPSDQVEVAAATLAMSFSHDVWLPLQSELGDFYRDPGPFRPWLTAIDFTYEAGLDLEDPYASRDARSGVRPIDDVVQTFDLFPEAPFERRWTDPAGTVALDTEVWGGRIGRGRHQTERTGRRTYASVSRLRDLCRAWDATLVVVTFSRIYLKERIDEDAFPSRWAVSSLDSKGPVRPLVRTSRAVRESVAALDRETRREFDQLYAAVERAMDRPT